MLELSNDELLSTTRAVRKRLDLERSVDRDIIEECLKLALQAPNGGNMNNWHWLVVDDQKTIARMAEIYNQGLEDFIATFGEQGYAGADVLGADRIESSTQHLRDHFHELPAVLLPMVAGRTDQAAGYPGAAFYQASIWGSVIQAVWSFMLALRSRGLGSAWTTGHLWREQEMADLLGIPYNNFMQVGLFPIAYTKGVDFKPAHREPLQNVLSWNRFEEQ